MILIFSKNIVLIQIYISPYYFCLIIVHGNWSSWSQWSSCSVTCSNGTVTRSRSCIDPTPQYGGNDCTGAENETDTCFSGIPCPGIYFTVTFENILFRTAAHVAQNVITVVILRHIPEALHFMSPK